MKAINNKTETMITICKNLPLSTEDNRSTLQLCQTRISKHQVIDIMIHPDTLHCLSEWQGIEPLSERPPLTNVETRQHANATNDQINHMSSISSIEELTEKKKYISIKDHFNESNGILIYYNHVASRWRSNIPFIILVLVSFIVKNYLKTHVIIITLIITLIVDSHCNVVAIKLYYLFSEKQS